MEDLIHEHKIFSHVNVMCFTETYLKAEYDIERFLRQYKYIDFRSLFPSHGKHGLMICASPKIKPRDLKLDIRNGLEFKAVHLETMVGPMMVCVM